MFGLFRLAFMLLIGFIGIGWYLGWFSLTQTSQDPQTNKVNLNVSLDRNKIKADIARAEQNLAKRLQETQQAVGQPNGQQGSGQQPMQGQWPVTIQNPGQAPNQGGGPALSFGPVSVQTPSLPQAQNYSFGPVNVQTPPPAAGQPQQIQMQGQGYQFSMPVGQPGAR